MARSTPTISISTLPSGDLKFSISNDDWKRIESAYGHVVPTKARKKIQRVMLQFFQFAEVEQRARPVSEARKRVERVKKAATELKTAIFEQDIGRDARTYANSLIRRYFNDARVKSGDGPRQLGTLMTSLIVACNHALQHLSHPNNLGLKKGEAWEGLVRGLTAILKNHHLQIKVRKDFDKNKTGKPSPFVLFMRELQSCLPDKFRRSEHSDVALAEAIHRARRLGRVTKGGRSRPE